MGRNIWPGFVHGLWRSAGRSIRKKIVGKGGAEGEDSVEGWKRRMARICGWRNRGRKTEGGQERVWKGWRK